jgi:hypothetical protein
MKTLWKRRNFIINTSLKKEIGRNLATVLFNLSVGFPMGNVDSDSN